MDALVTGVRRLAIEPWSTVVRSVARRAVTASGERFGTSAFDSGRGERPMYESSIDR
jgi:hypothetical protein